MNQRKVKRYITEAVILIAVFIVAVMIFSHFTNEGKDNMTADMGAATYPQVSFSYDGYSINNIPGYAQEMDIASLRDTITPVANGKIEIKLSAYDNEITSMDCNIYSLDGKEKLLDAKVEEPGESVTVSMGDASVIAEERVLQIVLNLAQNKSVYYYTRIVDGADKHVSECLNYIKNFHDNALIKAEGVGIGTAIEPDETGDNGTLQHVTIHSDYDHVTWGELEPSIEGKESWMIKEINSVSSSVQLQYRVRCKGEENEEDVYKVKEFFRVRYRADAKKGLLLDYDRTMEQIFDTTKKMLNEKGILLGVADPDTPYMTNKKGQQTAFVQADELWYYNKDTDEMALVFSFDSSEATDERNRTAQHKIKLLEMDKKGNLSFAVYGYMNRGEHEGEVGAAVYYYDIAQNSVEEKVFISTKKSYGHAILELGNLVYYSVNRNMLYVMSNGTFYEIDVEKERTRELMTGLEDDQYVVSEDGSCIAYQSKDEEGFEVTVMSLASGKERTVTCESGQRIKPLGFMDTDFVYGLIRTEDEGTSLSGESVNPMYKIEIQSSKGKVIKTYEEKGMYVTNTVFQDNMITLERVMKKDNTYQSIIEEHITNNEEKEESNISVASYTTSLKQRQIRIVYADGIEEQEPKVLMPKQKLFEKPKVFSFDEATEEARYLVYGYGELRGIYKRAGDAVIQADEYNGVVLSSGQEYIWERGNRDLRYTISEQDSLIENMRAQIQNKTAPVDVITQITGREALNLTGCTAEELMYIINRNKPVIAMKDADKAIILIGYTESQIKYIDVDSGENHSVSAEELEEMTEKSGHTYIA